MTKGANRFAEKAVESAVEFAVFVAALSPQQSASKIHRRARTLAPSTSMPGLNPSDLHPGVPNLDPSCHCCLMAPFFAMAQWLMRRKVGMRSSAAHLLSPQQADGRPGIKISARDPRTQRPVARSSVWSLSRKDKRLLRGRRPKIFVPSCWYHSRLPRRAQYCAILAPRGNLTLSSNESHHAVRCARPLCVFCLSLHGRDTKQPRMLNRTLNFKC